MRRLLLLLATLAVASAHEVSESFLRIKAGNELITGRWEVSLRDLEIAVGLDQNQDDLVTRNEVEAARPKLASALRRAILIQSTAGELELSEVECLHKTFGSSLALNFTARTARSTPFNLRYDFMFQYDRSHRALLTVNRDGWETVAVLTASSRSFEATALRRNSFFAFLRQGVIHIWEGADHVAFLLALLLPTVLVSGAEQRQPRKIAARICRIVTAFTIAHSLTLAVATIGLAQLPSRIVESVIAFSVILAAANNLAGFWNERSWLVAFLFGLIHGFGFASVLSELQLERGNIATALLGFNGGVEFGQLAIVAIFLPLAYAARHTWVYRRLIFQGGSIGIALVACGWIIERAFSVSIFSLILPT